MILVGVFGAEGRMGQAIVEQLSKSKDLKLGAQIDKRNLKDLSQKSLQAVIDFSSPAGTVEICKWCIEHAVPLVVGTTGLNAQENEMLKSAGKKIPIFFSPNMSAGVFGFNEALRAFFQVVHEGDVEIEETHHVHKKDAPSGTAKAIHEVILNATQGSQVKVGNPKSERVGDVFGIHRVKFLSEGEWVSFEHHATDRAVFAKGAVTAARWLIKQTPGYYQMKDMLKS